MGKISFNTPKSIPLSNAGVLILIISIAEFEEFKFLLNFKLKSPASSSTVASFVKTSNLSIANGV